MVSSLYAALSALLIVWLSLNVINFRRSKQVSLGDGGEPELQVAIRAQGNAVEYIPICLILLVLLEFNGASFVSVHLAGIAIFVGRLLHAYGLLKEQMRYRVLGMQMTIFTLVGLALANLGYVIQASLQKL